ncbi:MAG: response regulator [Dehalococcoidia bacterium]
MVENRRILLVDDEPDFLEAFRMTLQAKNFDVIATSNKAQAQEKMNEDPAIVVLGTLAPVGDAFSMHQWLKKHPRFKSVPLIVIDARKEERSVKGWRRHEGMQLEADEFVSKPIEPAVLVPRLQSLLEEVYRIIRVLVADDHTVVRDGICSVLALQKDMEVVAEVPNGKEAIDKVLRLMPDVALLDIVMPVMSGIDAARRITSEYPQTRSLMLTQYDEMENMIACRQAGAFGFIPKKAASGQLVTGVRTVSKGDYFPEPFAELEETFTSPQKPSGRILYGSGP